MGNNDLMEINHAINQFFSIFNNKDGAKPNSNLIHSLLLPEATITRVSAGNIEVFNIEDFIKPRIEMLTDGTLTEFSESQTEKSSEVFAQIAQHQCTFEKQGFLNDEPYQGTGTKLFHLVRIGELWKISAVIWQDF